MMARGTDAEVVVVGLVGERGREVREFLEDDLGPEGAQAILCRGRDVGRTGADATTRRNSPRPGSPSTSQTRARTSCC